MTIDELRIRCCERIAEPRVRQAILAAIDAVEAMTPARLGLLQRGDVGAFVLLADLRYGFEGALQGEST